jgi:hypothetical protein
MTSREHNVLPMSPTLVKWATLVKLECIYARQSLIQRH